MKNRVCERGHSLLICVPGANPVSLSSVAKPFRRFDNADVAQLVEHHLAKVRVAGSSPVIRSGDWRSGSALP